ncbi:STAS domain-containing protein [Streptomyces sp. NPDC059447]|uniref:STAS domain-containing protein n=1 Tax=Streptomyces sp. NPDC059447 TaxID=3346834 RepID=UPI0036A0AACC
MVSSNGYTDYLTMLRRQDQYVLRVSGDMDLDHVARLRTSLMTALSEAPEGWDLVVDLQNSSFCDSTGLNALLAAREQAWSLGHRVLLAAPSHQMIRLLQLTGSADLFPLSPGVADHRQTEQPE